MIDDWKPENLPIMLMSRSLLTATKTAPFRIGTARVTASDQDAIIAMDKLFEDQANEDEDEISRGRLPGRYQADGQDWIEELTDLPYQISYYFPSRLRNNRVGTGSYGSNDMTFKVLYEALCTGWNGGRRFIEDYFLSCFRDRMQERYAEAVVQLKQDIADEAQQRRARKKAYLHNFDAWSGSMTKETFSDLGKQTKQDIIACLSTGKIPLNKNGISEQTMRTRQRLGIDSSAVFYATGRLIGSIQVSVVLLDKNTADKEGNT
jgi:hypothetical protein